MATSKEIETASKTSSTWLRKRKIKHVEWVQESIRKLQNDILDALTGLNMTNGVIDQGAVNFAKAQQIHTQLNNLFEKDFNAKTKIMVNDFRKAAPQVKSNFATLGEVASFTGVDNDMMRTLRDGYYQDYLAIGNQAKDKVARAMYSNVIGNGRFSSLVTEIRAALLGSAAVSATGRPLAQYARLYARDMIMNYHNNVMLMKADDLDMNYYKYIGSIMSRSRKFCIQRVNRTFSKKEIQSWTYRWAGKSGPALTYRGGYNCRHHWQPVRKDWLSDDAQGKINALRPIRK